MSGIRRNSSSVTAALAILCAALGWMVYEEAWSPQRILAPAAPDVALRAVQEHAKTVPVRTTPALPPVDMFTEITARPLFNASRRPIAAEQPAAEVKKSELNIMLSGIVIDHARQIAHLRSATDQRVQALSVGDAIGSWRIEAIEPDRVVLRAGNQVETLFIQDFGSHNATGGANEGAKAPAASPRRPRSPDRSGWRSRTNTRDRQFRER